MSARTGLSVARKTLVLARAAAAVAPLSVCAAAPAGPAAASARPASRSGERRVMPCRNTPGRDKFGPGQDADDDGGAPAGPGTVAVSHTLRRHHGSQDSAVSGNGRRFARVRPATIDVPGATDS